mgnify:FL=1
MSWDVRVAVGGLDVDRLDHEVARALSASSPLISHRHHRVLRFYVQYSYETTMLICRPGRRFLVIPPPPVPALPRVSSDRCCSAPEVEPHSFKRQIHIRRSTGWAPRFNLRSLG